MSDNSEKEKMESYFNKIKSKKPEIIVLAWTTDIQYKNVIIKFEGNGIKIILDSTESFIWKLILEEFSTTEQLINSACENGFNVNQTVRILYNMETKGIISLRSNSIWDEEV